MQIKEARQLLLRATDSGYWIERSCANDFVQVGSDIYTDPAVLEAVEALLQEGLIEQIPTAGQSRSSVGYKRSRQTYAEPALPPRCPSMSEITFRPDGFV
jgi:hypothetical protein